MRQQLVQTAVQGVRLRQGEILPQQITHRTRAVPLPMQAPLAAGVDQPVADQGLEHVQPARALARGRQARRPVLIEPELLPELQRQPARTPLAGPMQGELRESDLDRGPAQRRHRAVIGKQRQRLGRVAALVQNIDRAAPGGVLRVVDLAKVEHLALEHTLLVDAVAFDDAPVAVHLAVFDALLGAQKHARESLRAPCPPSRTKVGTTGENRAFAGGTCRSVNRLRPAPNPKIAGARVESRKSG